MPAKKKMAVRRSPGRRHAFRRADRAARVGRWKWLDSAQGHGLFDLEQDPGETRDLSAEHPDIVRRLQERFAAWRREMDACEVRGPFRDV